MRYPDNPAKQAVINRFNDINLGAAVVGMGELIAELVEAYVIIREGMVAKANKEAREAMQHTQTLHLKKSA